MELSLFFVPPNNDANMGSGQQWSDDNDVSTDTNSYQMTGKIIDSFYLIKSIIDIGIIKYFHLGFSLKLKNHIIS